MKGQNTIAAAALMSVVERIERLEEERSGLADDIRAIYASAKADGYTPKYIRAVIKRRKQKPADMQEEEAMLDMYFHAAGLAKETPLFRHVGAMSVDKSARDQVVAAFKELAPTEGEIIVKMGGQPVRIWRDKDGEAHAEDVVEAPPALAASPAESPSAAPARANRPAPPDVDEDGAFNLGRKAAKDNTPIIDNPFPWDDRRRPQWDQGWRAEAGSDGMGPEE